MAMLRSQNTITNFLDDFILCLLKAIQLRTMLGFDSRLPDPNTTARM